MCGSLRREGHDKLVGQDPQPSGLQASWGKPGENFSISDKDGNAQGYFNGHARSETLQETFLKRGWQKGQLFVTGYTEKGRTYDVPKGYVIQVVTRNIPSRGKIFNIVTRPAEGAELDVHDRFPVIQKRE